MARDAQYVPILPSFDGFFKEVGKGAEKGGAQAGKTFADSMAREVKKAEGAVEKATLQVERARVRQANAADKTTVASAKLAEVMEKENAKASEIAKARTDLAKAQRDEELNTKALEAANVKLQRAQTDLTKKTQEAEDATGDFAKAQAAAGDSSDGLIAGLDKTKLAFAAVSGAIAAVGGALYGIGTTFDEAWDTIRVGTGASGEALEGLKDTARNVAAEVPASIEDIGTAVADINTRLGLTGEPLEKFASQMIQLENLGVDADINAVSQALNGFGVEAESMPDALDELFQVSQATGLSVTELSNSAVKAGPALREFGFSLGDSAALAGQLDKAGINADGTMQRMQRALAEFAKEGRDAPSALMETIEQIDELVASGQSIEAIDMASGLFGTRGAAQFVDAVKTGTLSVDDFMAATGATEDTILGVAEETMSFAEQWQVFKNRALLAIEPVSEAVFNLAGGAMETAADKLEVIAEWMTSTLIPAVSSFVDWVDRSAGAIAAAAVPVGILAGAYGALVLQQKIATAGGFLQWLMKLTAVEKAHAAVTKGVAAAQAALNTVMNANPIFLVVTAVTALVAGLAIFFTKTETGREIWGNFTDGLTAGWEKFTGVFKSSIDWISDAFTGLKALIVDGDFTGALASAFGLEENSPVVGFLLGVRDAFITVWDAGKAALGWIANALKVTFAVVGTAAIYPFIAGWNVLSTAIQFAWSNIFKPVFSGIGSLISGLWNNVLKPIGGLIKSGWDLLVGAIQAGASIVTDVIFPAIGAAASWLWDNALGPYFDNIRAGFDMLVNGLVAGAEWIQNSVWNPIVAGATWLWDNGLQPVFSMIVDGWNWVGNALGEMGEWVRINVIEAFAAAVSWLWEEGISPVLEWISGKWDWMTSMLNDGFVFVRDTVFAGLKLALDSVKAAFDVAVDGIGKAWDMIRDLTRRPVEFVVNTVYNNGIRKAWNAVGKLVGLDELPEYRFSTGGILPGYTPGRDVYDFIEPNTGMRIGLSGGEPILRPEAGRVLGSGWVDGINSAARIGGVKGVRDFLYGPDSGKLGGFAAGGVVGSIVDWVHKYYPMMTITSTFRNSNDNHGRGLAVDFSNSTDSTPQMRSAAQNLFDNYGKGLLELIHSPFNHNVKNGQDKGDGFGWYGASIMNQHRNHVHVASPQPLGDPKTMVEMVWDGAQAVFASLRDRVSGLFNPIINAVKEKVDSFKAPGIIGELPGAMFGSLWDAAKDFILGKADESDNYGGPGGTSGNVESWREMAMAAMRRNGFNADDPAQVNAMLKQIMSESSGIPDRAQEIVDINGTGESAGLGLLQIIPGTFADFRDPSLPNDRRDPWANMNAALRYYKSKYGTDLTTMWGHGHGYALGGILPALTRLYDRGGWLPHGAMALNLSGRPEPVLTDEHWDRVSELIRQVGEMVPHLKATTDVIADILIPAMRELAAAWTGETDGARVHLSRLIGEDNARAASWSAAWAGTASVKDLFDTFTKLPGLDTYTRVFAGIVDGHDAVLQKYDEHDKALKNIADKEEALAEARKALKEAESGAIELDKNDKRKLAAAEEKLAKARKDGKPEKIAEAEKKLAEVREDIADKQANSEEKKKEAIKAAQEKVLAAELDLSNARGAAADIAKAAGQAQIALAIEVANVVFDVIDTLITNFTAARTAVWGGVVEMMGSVRELTELIAKQREAVVGLALDFVAAHIDVREAARQTRFTQIAGAEATLKAARGVAEAQAAFDEQRRKDMKSNIGMYTDLSLATDRWRWNVKEDTDAALDNMSEWSDETMAAYEALQAAHVGMQIEELKAQEANLDAVHSQHMAVLDLADTSRNMQKAMQKLAVLSREAFGFDQVGATVGERYAKLARENAEIEAKKAQASTWMNPANWFNGYYKNANRRQEQIRKEMDELAARDDFQGVAMTDKEIRKMTAGAGFMGLFGGAGDIDDLINNSPLGDAARSLDKVQWETDLIDLKDSQNELSSTIERGTAELAYRNQKGELADRIRAKELERDSHSNWSEYWRATNDEVRAAIADIATYQGDTAKSLKAIADKKSTLVFQIPEGKDALSVRELEEIQEAMRKQNADIELRLEKMENPRLGGAAVSGRVRA
ncbi:phage tail tape measure protein [Corynebacterium minutissimum]|uniref:Immunity-specific protein Beta241 n=1 Tax=Corynebacterium minutissimum TaxID=38301 RepID=A0A376CXJ5_9CORY|nr:phage tail tape measure protein [Corynebacterium minutissimum]QRP60878.1 phage tail tape measure protein [Corynebacterium minutissimum]STC77539.1 immunity-specific protein Beta241 [Corynebacterium minutissimum]